MFTRQYRTVKDLRLAKPGGVYYMCGYCFPIKFTGIVDIDPNMEPETDRRFSFVVDEYLVQHVCYKGVGEGGALQYINIKEP